MYFLIDIHMFASYNRPVDDKGIRALNFNTDESKHQSKKTFDDLINEEILAEIQTKFIRSLMKDRLKLKFKHSNQKINNIITHIGDKMERTLFEKSITNQHK